MNLGADPMPWTSEQREWLQALGHDLLTVAAADPEAPEQADAVAQPAAATSRPAATPSKPVSATPPLLRALARAARRSEDDPELLKTVPDLAILRGNPAARRALWPRLRALRKRAPQ